MSPLDAEEVKGLLMYAREEVPSLYAIVLCAVRTGLRQGELIGLQWSDIDFRSGFLEVRRAVVKRQLTSTKNHKLRRVDMSPQLSDVLRHMQEIRELEAISGKPVSEWVFVTPSRHAVG